MSNAKRHEVTLNDNDVLKANKSLPGTMKYYELLERFDSDENPQCALIAKKILHQSKAMNPPLRFLKKAGEGDCFEEVSDKRTIENITDDLRLKKYL